MHLLSKITSYKSALIFLFFFVMLRSLFFNINAAEWGDSYRILRAAEYIKEGSYPENEKRPPLVSAVLALRPSSIDQVTFCRYTLALVSLLVLIVFHALLKEFIKNESLRLWTLLVLALNNVYFYWSIRIMADVPFSLVSLLVFLLVLKLKKNNSLSNKLLLGVLLGLSILTRFEGYILLGSVVLGIFIQDFGFNFKKLWKAIEIYYPVLIGVLVVLLPYWLYRNPLNSSYLEEPAGRAYDLKMFFTYLVSYVYVLGIFIAPLIFGLGFTSIKKFLLNNLPIFIFLILESVLILLWPAAVPRLFVPLIPILTILLGIGAEEYFNSPQNFNKWGWVFVINLFVWYVIAQYFLRLQFLILTKPIFVANIVLQAVLVLSFYYKKVNLLLFFGIFTLLIWAISSVYLHRNLLKSVKMAAEHIAQNLEGTVGYNDVSSVSDWYINYSTSKPLLKGFYYNTEKKQNLEQDKLKEAGIDYLLITNEHNTTMTLDLNKRAYLEQVAVFQYNVNGQVFNSRVVKVK